MARRLSLFLLLGFIVVACGSCPTDPGIPRYHLSVGGLDRTYLVHTPAGYDASTPLPVVVMLHGFLESAAQAARVTGFAQLADQEGFIAVFPNGVSHAWRYQREIEDTPVFLRRVDDVAFINALVDRLETDYAVDPARLYVAGFSNGGFMAQRLACECPGRFAAIASVCASLPFTSSQECQSCAPVPVALFGGTGDPILPWDGGQVPMGATRRFGLLSFPDTAAFWAMRNGCDGQPQTLSLPDLDPNDGTTVERARYATCSETGAVDFYTVHGGGHAWPGGHAGYPRRIVGLTSRDINATDLIWDFFKTHPGTPPAN